MSITELDELTVLEMVHGDHKTARIIIPDVDGEPLVWTPSMKVWFTVRKNYTDSTYLFQHSSPAGGISLPVDGEAVCEIVPADTSDLPNEEMQYKFDVQIKDASNRIRTTERGILNVLPEVTLETS